MGLPEERKQDLHVGMHHGLFGTKTFIYRRLATLGSYKLFAQTILLKIENCYKQNYLII